MSEIDAKLATALRAVFEPFAALLLKQPVEVKPVLEILKQSFVRAAFEESGRDDKPASISAVARATGLTRSEVRRIRDELADAPRASEAYSPTEAEATHAWYSQQKFMTPAGTPKDLEFGPGPGSFCELVGELSTRISAEELLQRLQAGGTVTVTAEGLIRMVSRTHPIGPNLPKLLINSLAPIASTINKNWRVALVDALIQRAAHSSTIDPAKIDSVRRVLRDRTASFIEEVDDHLIAHESPSGEPFHDREGRQLSRMGVGAFYFEIEE